MTNMYKLLFSSRAKEELTALTNHKSYEKRIKAVRKALGHLQINPRHPSLNTHKFTALSGPDGEEVFEAYAENRTPAAYRIFWYYGPEKHTITIFAITKHP